MTTQHQYKIQMSVDEAKEFFMNGKERKQRRLYFAHALVLLLYCNEPRLGGPWGDFAYQDERIFTKKEILRTLECYNGLDWQDLYGTDADAVYMRPYTVCKTVNQAQQTLNYLYKIFDKVQRPARNHFSIILSVDIDRLNFVMDIDGEKVEAQLL